MSYFILYSRYLFKKIDTKIWRVYIELFYLYYLISAIIHSPNIYDLWTKQVLYIIFRLICTSYLIAQKDWSLSMNLYPSCQALTNMYPRPLFNLNNWKGPSRRRNSSGDSWKS